MILLGIVFIILGTVMLAFNRQIYGFTGPLDFIDNHLQGGTPGFLKLVAVILVLVGIFMATGLGHVITDPIQRGINSAFPKSTP